MAGKSLNPASVLRVAAPVALAVVAFSMLTACETSDIEMFTEAFTATAACQNCSSRQTQAMMEQIHRQNHPHEEVQKANSELAGRRRNYSTDATYECVVPGWITGGGDLRVSVFVRNDVWTERNNFGTFNYDCNTAHRNDNGYLIKDECTLTPDRIMRNWSSEKPNFFTATGVDIHPWTGKIRVWNITPGGRNTEASGTCKKAGGDS